MKESLKVDDLLYISYLFLIFTTTGTYTGRYKRQSILDSSVLSRYIEQFIHMSLYTLAIHMRMAKQQDQRGSQHFCLISRTNHTSK